MREIRLTHDVALNLALRVRQKHRLPASVWIDVTQWYVDRSGKACDLTKNEHLGCPTPYTSWRSQVAPCDVVVGTVLVVAMVP